MCRVPCTLRPCRRPEAQSPRTGRDESWRSATSAHGGMRLLAGAERCGCGGRHATGSAIITARPQAAHRCTRYLDRPGRRASATPPSRAAPGLVRADHYHVRGPKRNIPSRPKGVTRRLTRAWPSPFRSRQTSVSRRSTSSRLCAPRYPGDEHPRDGGAIQRVHVPYALFDSPAPAARPTSSPASCSTSR